MSTAGLRGCEARVDRWEFPVDSPQEWEGKGRGGRWWPMMAVAPLLAFVVEATPPTPGSSRSEDSESTAESGAANDSPDLREPAPGLVMLPNGLPTAAQPRVERWLGAFETTRRHEFEELMARRGVYSGLIEEKLRRRGMPSELLYIPMIESGLSTVAVSHVSAVGLWQFMVPTAQQYGLRVDPWVDERRDPEAATDAALDYLSWLHRRFGGSWILAAAAYNAGPGRLERVLNRHAEGRLGDDEVYWEILEYLPRETREYVPKMIAVTRLAAQLDEQGFESGSVEPYRYESVFVPGGTQLSYVARELGLERGAVKALNPHLVLGVTPPDELYPLRVPVGQGMRVVSFLAERPSRGLAAG
jgi:membrane-bound lytic murein transglycosylase D